jgi:hypothetical protein
MRNDDSLSGFEDVMKRAEHRRRTFVQSFSPNLVHRVRIATMLERYAPNSSRYYMMTDTNFNITSH